MIGKQGLVVFDDTVLLLETSPDMLGKIEVALMELAVIVFQLALDSFLDPPVDLLRRDLPGIDLG
jgi:hypothetical protein